MRECFEEYFEERGMFKENAREHPQERLRHPQVSISIILYRSLVFAVGSASEISDLLDASPCISIYLHGLRNMSLH